jgi:hypothetical protein
MRGFLCRQKFVLHKLAGYICTEPLSDVENPLTNTRRTIQYHRADTALFLFLKNQIRGSARRISTILPFSAHPYDQKTLQRQMLSEEMSGDDMAHSHLARSSIVASANAMPPSP